MTAVRTLLLPALFALVAGGSALAEQPLSGMITANDVDRIEQLARAYGSVERRQDEDGVWLRGDMDGIIYTLSFLNCDERQTNCTSAQFRAWWQSGGAHSLEAMNQWNRDRRFSAAYLDESNNATIEWDVNLAGGVSAVNFDDSIQWWQAVVRQFRETVIDPGYEAAGVSGGSGTTSTPQQAPQSQQPPAVTK